jgi:lipid II:glycine glycyltransferase (peptidoglycan interpeptide bridge formation enzyme)
MRTVNDYQEWDSALASLPSPHVLQSWDWGEFKCRWGWSAERLLWLNGDHALAAAQVLARSIPRTPWRFLYVSKGPILDYGNLDLVSQVLTDLETYAHQHNALFIKIDPDVPRQWGEPQPQTKLDPVGAAVLDLLDRHGWRFSPEQIQFRNTVLLDLSVEPEALLARMKSKWRYNIRVAERKNVNIRRGGLDDWLLFYRMYAETARRDGFLIRPEAYYLDIWRRFWEIDRADLLLAEGAGEAVAGLVLFYFGQQAWYLYGASTGRHRNLMPNYLLQWAAICQAKARGCTHYDLWGAPDVFNESDRLWGVYRFKQGFGGEVMQGMGAYDYPVKPVLYTAFARSLPKARSIMRRLRG